MAKIDRLRIQLPPGSRLEPVRFADATANELARQLATIDRHALTSRRGGADLTVKAAPDPASIGQATIRALTSHGGGS